MIQCPECKKEVSESATACPSCGFPVAKHLAAPQKEKESADKKQGCAGCLGIVGIIFLLGGIGGCYRFITEKGSRPPEEGLEDFKFLGTVGTIMVVIAWKLFSSTTKKGK